MLSKKEFLEVNERFYDLLTGERIRFGTLLPYEPYSIPTDAARGPAWMVFHMMSDAYVNELLNNINQFSSKGHRLTAWTRVLKEIVEEDKRLSVLIEIVDPVFADVLNQPYAIKSRLVYVTAHLLREMATLLKFSFKDFADVGINYRTLQTFKPLIQAQGWTTFDPFAYRLRQINQDGFKRKSQNFRDRFHHRMPPAVEIGILSVVQRSVDERGLSYEFGVEDPVSIADVLPILVSRHEACANAFLAFWEFLMDLINVWKANTEP